MTRSMVEEVRACECPVAMLMPIALPEFAHAEEPLVPAEPLNMLLLLAEEGRAVVTPWWCEA